MLEKDACDLLKESFEQVVASQDRNFGNGRYARNVFEEALKAQANRLAQQTSISEQDLTLIKRDGNSVGLKKASTNVELCR